MPGAGSPDVAAAPFKTEHVNVAPGQVAGINHQARAFVGDQEVIHLWLRMGIGNEEPHDRVVIRVEPSIDWRATPCTPGDIATAAVLVNLAGWLPDAPNGLQTSDRIGLGAFGRRLKVCWQR